MPNPPNKPRGFTLNFLPNLSPLWAWLIKDLPCAACSQPATFNALALQTDLQPELQEASQSVQLPAKTVMPPTSQHLPSIRLCPNCTAALAPRKQGYCQFCALPFPGGSTSMGPCAACAQKKPTWQGIYFLAAYEGMLQKLLLALKFQNGLYVAPLLGKFLAQRIKKSKSLKYQQPKTLTPALSKVIPVPLFTKRLKERGYNQSLEIARMLAKDLGLPLEHKTLIRIKHSIPQERLNRQERLLAVQGAFAVPEICRANLAGKHVLLVDDVMTTGATIEECTRMLLNAGAAAVSIAVVARTGLE